MQRETTATSIFSFPSTAGLPRIADFGVQFFLEDLLGRPVDLVTEKSLRSELRPFIEREAVNV